jgi:hypothetical protein
MASASPRSGLKAVPRGVWAIGFVSMFMDVSSEMIHSLLPIFLVGTLERIEIRRNSLSF